MPIIPGLYQLLIRLKHSAELSIGALGERHFAPGWYVYTGSARRGLRQRIDRHLRREKRCHWHIDYLLAGADEVKAYVLPEPAISECDLHASLVGGEPVSGFGCSDCTCGSHLAYFRKRPRLQLTPYVLSG